MEISPRRALVGSVATVGLGSALLPLLPLYPTILEYLVALGGYFIVTSAKSSEFADGHFAWVWSAAVLVHLLIFSIPALAIWLGFRNRKPRLCSALVGTWCLAYLMLVLFLFPASARP